MHLNSILFSHAFSVAVEGGRNATSNLSVSGVGAANRAQIEKVFFRAETPLMPNNANFQTAAAAVIQAAIDLYGAGGAPTRAVTQAMVAVGLRAIDALLRAAFLRRCPFLALSVHQGAANGGKARHKAKLENRSMVAATLPDSAASSKPRQSAANDAFSAC